MVENGLQNVRFGAFLAYVDQSPYEEHCATCTCSGRPMTGSSARAGRLPGPSIRAAGVGFFEAEEVAVEMAA
jgi:hypothetical protein